MNYQLVDFAFDGQPKINPDTGKTTQDCILMSRDMDSPHVGKFLQKDLVTFEVGNVKILDALNDIKNVQAPAWVNSTYNQ